MQARQHLKTALGGFLIQVILLAVLLFDTHKAGYSKTTAQTGAVTLIQRFGGAPNLNIHCHMLILDGVYNDNPMDPVRGFTGY